MFLATLKVSMDLEPEVPSQDRERVMRSLRDKVRQSFNHRVTVRTDDDVSLYMALYDESFERTRDRVEDLVELIDSTGEARISISHAQVFSWFEGKFVETKDTLDDSVRESREQDKMIVYRKDDDVDEVTMNPNASGTTTPRFNRRQMRIPTRK